MKTLSSCILLFLLLIGNLEAQQLLQPLESIPLSNKGYVLLKTGEIVEGKIRSTNSGRGINQVKIEDSEGQVHTLKAAEIEEFAIAMNGAVRLQYASERGSSVKKLLSRDQPTAKPKDFILFRSTSINGKKELLLQLLNPDFDEIFEVFYDPFARKTTTMESKHIVWTGDKHRAYFISKNLEPVVKIKKGNYRRVYASLFGDCEQMRAGRKPKLDDLASHILLYQNHCLFN
ncbi:hypothetical protein [Cyclobacterium jeungdonense]|uniref:Uncharacterized protein n=1 Tax=Cyclobacterium jeungdonense TaxID=708087 RepID=A0ABT8C3A8_9BACT|nr:hypothetical protein [Cyclobacterium jeungdonense]MDN3687263.1 hypothetical protein [Cyclobacterium jeungdonense]